VFVIFPRSGGQPAMAPQVVAGGKDAMETGFALSEIDTTTPHPAGRYVTRFGGQLGRLGHTDAEETRSIIGTGWSLRGEPATGR
jgi:hypothetical protein